MTPWNRHDSREFKNLIKHLPENSELHLEIRPVPPRKTFNSLQIKMGYHISVSKDNATH
jgi:hypothetical protein